jgi:hypothetical protein
MPRGLSRMRTAPSAQQHIYPFTQEQHRRIYNLFLRLSGASPNLS